MSKSYGVRNAKGDPLDTDTILYGASLTKAVFATAVMQLVDEGVIDLDTTIDHYLPKPLPSYAEPEVEDNYARWGDLAGDDRWKKLTPRILLTHSPGFANFGFLKPDGKLRFHFDPGMRFAYRAMASSCSSSCSNEVSGSISGAKCSGGCSTTSACATRR